MMLIYIVIAIAMIVYLALRPIQRAMEGKETLDS